MAQNMQNIAELSYDDICKLENHIEHHRLVAHLVLEESIPDFIHDFEFFYMLIPEPVHWNLYDDVTFRFNFHLLRTGIIKEDSIKKYWSLFRLELKQEFKLNRRDSTDNLL
jgi:hypothetical protein